MGRLWSVRTTRGMLLGMDETLLVRFAHNLFFEVGLYEVVPLPHEYALREVARSGIRFQEYCPQCKTETALAHEAIYQSAYERSMGTLPQLPNDELCAVVRCQINHNHVLRFYIRQLPGHQVVKVGQYPSVKDIAKGRLARYGKVLDDQDHGELATALGLFSHGVGVGSFVYLRRILERMLFKTNGRRTEPIPDDTFRPLHTDEKVAALKDDLPSFLADNGFIFGILGKGIHALSEDECRHAFPALRIAIEQILDEEVERADKVRRAADAKILLNQMNSEMAQRLQQRQQ